MLNRIWKNPICLLLALALLPTAFASGQRPRFNDSYVIPGGQIAPPTIGAAPGLPAGGVMPTAPANMIPTLPQNPGAVAPYPGGATVGQPVLIQKQIIDPFATQTGGVPWSPYGGYPGAGGTYAMPANPSVQPPQFTYPPPAGTYNTVPPLPQTITNTPGGVYAPGSWPWIQPDTNGAWSNTPSAWPNEMWNRLRSSEVYRLLERPRWRHTYIAPLGDTQFLGWNQSEIATTLTIPNFLFTAQPLRLSPGFTFNFWEGPDTMITGADLPGQTYDAFLAADYSSPWDRQLGFETNVTVGVYTDFDEVTSDSLRITGLGVGWIRLNNTTTFKVGVEYLDRIRVKLLPAIGFFIYPTPNLKLDIYFPRPRLSHRLPNLGNYQVWSYLGGEYGGGSWTIERLGMMGDQADVNDIRVVGGLEWTGPRGVTGFLEAGYVFDREIIYLSAPNTEVDIDDSYLLRAGIAF